MVSTDTSVGVLKVHTHGSDMFVSTDLKDVYFHIPTPRVSLFCLLGSDVCLSDTPDLTLSRSVGKMPHLEDWLLAAESPWTIKVLTRLFPSHLTTPGFTINWENRVLTSNRTFTDLSLDSPSFRSQMSVNRVDVFLSAGTEAAGPRGHSGHFSDGLCHWVGTQPTVGIAKYLSSHWS